MITVKKTGKYAVSLKFDQEGARRLIGALSNIREDAEVKREIIIDVDPALWGGRKRELTTRTLRLAIQEANQSDGSITYEEDTVIWRLVESEDEINYAIQRIKEAIGREHFSPAEFLMIKIPKTRELVQIFGEIIP